MLNSIMEVKSVGTFPVILVKVATPPLPPKQSWILSKMDGNECFFGQSIAGGGGGGVGGRQHEPKADKKNCLGAESYLTITRKGFFAQSQVILSSIVIFGLSD